jgi:hypothetical protein
MLVAEPKKPLALLAPATVHLANLLASLSFQRRERFAGRLRPDLGKYPLQELNARRERITVNRPICGS